MPRIGKWILIGVAVAVPALVLAVWIGARPVVVRGGAAPLVWADCGPEQVQVLILGTFHFEQARGVDDILRPERQAELSGLLDQLETFAPDKVTVEYPYARFDSLDAMYRRFLETGEDRSKSRNEIFQMGFRLAHRLGHEHVFGVDEGEVYAGALKLCPWYDRDLRIV